MKLIVNYIFIDLSKYKILLNFKSKVYVRNFLKGMIIIKLTFVYFSNDVHIKF